MLRKTFSFFAGPVGKDDKQMDEASTEPGSEAASDGADASLPAEEASDGEPPACTQAAACACAAEEMTCGDRRSIGFCGHSRSGQF
jgi:hypothetical protein